MAKLYASLASSSVDPTQYSIGQGYLYTRQVYNFINNSLGNTLFYKSRVFKDANLIRNPLKRRYEEYDNAKSMDGSPYIGERYNIYEKLGRQIVFLDDVSGLTGYTYNEGYSDIPNSQMIANMVNAIDARGFNKLNEDETKPFSLYEQRTVPKVGIVGYPYGTDNMMQIGNSINTTIDRNYFKSTVYATYSNINSAVVSRRYGLYDEKSVGDSHSLNLGAGINDHQSDGAKLFQMFDVDGSEFKDSLLYKTNELFNAGKINSLINRFHTKKLTANDLSIAETAVDSEYGMSRGRNLRKLTRTNHNGYDNPYCRVWTSHHQYSKVSDRIRPFVTEDGNFKSIKDVQEKYGEGFRPFKGNERLNEMSSLQDNGYPTIVPHKKSDIKKCMFSIENLAWKDIKRELGVNGTSGKVLSQEQMGPFGGRIMWFPPYNLKFQENVGVQWEGNSFLGRGEQIYTYTNTERSGTLNFTILVDHPSIVDSWAYGLDSEQNTEREQELLRFFAGCGELEPNMPNVKTPKYKEIEEMEEIPDPPVDPEPDPKIGFEKRFYVFFPNNLSGEDYMDNPNVIANYLLYGSSGSTGGYEIGSGTAIGNTGPVTGCIKGSEIKGAHRTYKYEVDSKTINQYLRGKETNNSDINCFGLNSSFQDLLSGNTSHVARGTATEEDTKKLRELFNLQEYPIDNIMNFTDFLSGELNNLITQEVREDYDISVVVNGFASSHGGYVSTSANDKDKNDNNRLSTKRARYVMSLISSTNVIDNEYISFGENKTLTVKSESVNDLFAKASRSAEVIITFNPKEKAKPNLETEDGTQTISEYENVKVIDGVRYKVTKVQVPDGYVESTKYGYDDEYAYFTKIWENDSLIKKNIVKKVKYFDPAFHSITPEGFNARLTFLHQCTRQGPTYSSGDLNTGNMAGNLAFGRPPVCILRIGDFYNTKIIIDSISIDYNNGDGIQFDLNPEGIGIQPMMANITIGFKFLGGSDLSGPISRLQNAVSSNFFANASVYDRRADFRTTPGDENNKGYMAWNASFNNAMNKQNDSEKENNTEHIKFDG